MKHEEKAALWLLFGAAGAVGLAIFLNEKPAKAEIPVLYRMKKGERWSLALEISGGPPWWGDADSDRLRKDLEPSALVGSIVPVVPKNGKQIIALGITLLGDLDADLGKAIPWGGGSAILRRAERVT